MLCNLFYLTSLPHGQGWGCTQAQVEWDVTAACRLGMGAGAMCSLVTRPKESKTWQVPRWKTWEKWAGVGVRDVLAFHPRVDVAGVKVGSWVTGTRLPVA
jgi:hypothetical protein